MSYLQVTTVRPSLRVGGRYNSLRESAMQGIAPVKILNLHNPLQQTIFSSKKYTELMKCYMIQRTGASRYQRCTHMCSFGGKGESKNGNESSPWKSIEKAMSSFKKEQSLEDVLRQQMEKREYYDENSGGGGGDGGGGGGGSGGFGGTGDEGFSDIWDDILQVTLAIIALIIMYLYIIAGDQVMLFITDTFDFLSGKKGPRLRTIMYDFAQFYQKFRAKVPYDPYWLEKAIITTPTWWDSPEKYRRMLKSSSREIRSPEQIGFDSDSDSDSDVKAYTDSAYSDNGYNQDSDNENVYNKKAYNDDEDDDNPYGEDVDDY